MNNQLSNCCIKPVEVINEDEGTCFWICSKCKKPCDLYDDKIKSKNNKLKKDEIELFIRLIEGEKVAIDFMRGFGKPTETELNEEDYYNRIIKKLKKL